LDTPSAAPFADGAISIRLYGHRVPVREMLDALFAQADAAADAGFDGVTVSEHHGSFDGYFPNPLQLAAWLLSRLPRIWVAPFPLLLPLRPAGLVAEEVAWLSAMYPGRVALGVAAGSLPQDFDIAGVPLDDDLARRFAGGLEVLACALRGEGAGALGDDPAVQRCRTHPVPLLSAAMSHTAARRAASNGCGVLSDSVSSIGRLREVARTYFDAGGAGPLVPTRWVWVGVPPEGAVAKQMELYRSYSKQQHQQDFNDDALATIYGRADDVAERLCQLVATTHATALNLRVHVGGISPAAAIDQIRALGAEVLPLVRRGWPATTGHRST
jgi:alkanesulfonate monooxygenase SsuD/methylene tetrahydromethanopterin reductase-like flavin-dependent oxidoreductase (luciferase family)